MNTILERIGWHCGELTSLCYPIGETMWEGVCFLQQQIFQWFYLECMVVLLGSYWDIKVWSTKHTSECIQSCNCFHQLEELRRCTLKWNARVLERHTNESVNNYFGKLIDFFLPASIADDCAFLSNRHSNIPWILDRRMSLCPPGRSMADRTLGCQNHQQPCSCSRQILVHELLYQT